MRLLIILALVAVVTAAATQEVGVTLEEVQDLPQQSDLPIEEAPAKTRRQHIRGFFNRNANRRNNILNKSTSTSTLPPPTLEKGNRRLALLRNRPQRPKFRLNKQKSVTPQSPVEQEAELAVTTAEPALEELVTESEVIPKEEEPATVRTTELPVQRKVKKDRKNNFRGAARRQSRVKAQPAQPVVQVDNAEEVPTQTAAPRKRTRGQHRFRPRVINSAVVEATTATTTTSSRGHSRSRGNVVAKPIQGENVVKPATFRASRRGNRIRGSRLRPALSVTTEAAPLEESTKIMQEIIEDVTQQPIMKDMKLKKDKMEKLFGTEQITEEESKPEPEPVTEQILIEDSTDAALLEEDIRPLIMEDKISPVEDITVLPTEAIKEEIIEVSSLRPIVTTLSNNIRGKQQTRKITKQRIQAQQANVVKLDEDTHRFNPRKRNRQSSKTVQKQVQRVVPQKPEVKSSFVRVTLDRQAPVDNQVEESSSRSRLRAQAARERVNPRVIQPAEFQPARDPFEVEALAALDFGSEFSTPRQEVKYRPLVVRQQPVVPFNAVTTFRPPIDIKNLIANSIISNKPTTEPTTTTTTTMESSTTSSKPQPEVTTNPAANQRTTTPTRHRLATTQQPQLSKQILPATSRVTSRGRERAQVIPARPRITSPNQRQRQVVRKTDISPNTNSRRRQSTIKQENLGNNNARQISSVREDSKSTTDIPRQMKPVTKTANPSHVHSRPDSAPKIATTPSSVSSTPKPTPSPLFAPPLSNDVLSTIHETSHKPMFPKPNYGKSELQFKGSEVLITEVGTIEETHPDEVNLILSGLGSQRRGLARPPAKQKSKPTTTTTVSSIDLLDYYDYNTYDYDPAAVEYEYYYVYEDEEVTSPAPV